MQTLLVEDNPNDTRLFTLMAAVAGFDKSGITCHARLDDACDALGEGAFEIVFLDLTLPDAEGMPVLTAIAAKNPDVPIVVLTGRDDELALAALENGAQDYLIKDQLTPERLAQTASFAIKRKEFELEVKRHEQESNQAQKLEAIGQLAAGIAHEINTPMQFIGDNLFFLRQAVEDLVPLLQEARRLAGADAGGQPVGPWAQDLARLVEQADIDFLLAELPAALTRSTNGVERVTKIVRAMKEFSHPGTKERRLVQLANAVESTVTVCRHEWRNVAEVEIDIPVDLPSIPCFQADLNQALLNLVVNAAHAIATKLGDNAANKGKITVSACTCEEHVEIRVSDTGTGIPASARARIFEPFFTTKEVGKGTGQGLSVVHQIIVSRHGGAIEVETVPGDGTTFVLRLPLVAPETETHTTNRRASTPTAREA